MEIDNPLKKKKGSSEDKMFLRGRSNGKTDVSVDPLAAMPVLPPKNDTRKRTTVYLTIDNLKKLKIKALEESTDMSKLLNKLIEKNL